MQWLTDAGAYVFVPLFSHPDYDLVADFPGRLVRVQVKTSGQWHRDPFIVSLCTRGGNQSWNGVVKRMDASRCDSCSSVSPTGGVGTYPRRTWAAAPPSV